jgi:hypothetical protein
MQTQQQFEADHRKICSRKKRPGKGHGVGSCGRKIYKYLLKFRPERIDIFNKSTPEKRMELLICSK